MDIEGVLAWLQSTWIATAVAENDILFPWIESVHVLAIVLVVGTISIVDLRLLGLASLDISARRLMRDVIPYTWGAFAVAAITGSACAAWQAGSTVAWNSGLSANRQIAGAFTASALSGRNAGSIFVGWPWAANLRW